jgi:hypothetical protein
VLVVETPEPAEIRVDDELAGETEPRGKAHYLVRWAYPGEHRVEAVFERGGSAARDVNVASGTVKIRLAPSDAELGARHRRGTRFGIGAGAFHLYRGAMAEREVVYGRSTQGAVGFVEAVVSFNVSEIFDFAVVPRLGLGSLPIELGFTGTMTIATPDGPRSALLEDAYTSVAPTLTLVPSALALVRMTMLDPWGMWFGWRVSAEIPIQGERHSSFHGARINGAPIALDGSWSPRYAATPQIGFEVSPLSFRLGSKEEAELALSGGVLLPLGHTKAAFHQQLALRYLFLP